MPRPLSAGFAGAITDPVARLCLFYEAQFADGWLRLWTGDRTIVWNGNEWTGVGGWLVGISSIEETGEMRAAGVKVTVSGLSSAITSIALQSVRQGQPGRIYFGALTLGHTVGAGPDSVGLPADDDTIGVGADTIGVGTDTVGVSWLDSSVGEPQGLLAGEPEFAFEGLLDISEITEAAEGTAVTISYENHLASLERAKEWRWTDQDQRIAHPNDGGCRHTGALADQNIQWG